MLTTDGEHPPTVIAAVLTVIGMVGLVLAAFAWRGNRPALIALVALQALSALSAVPAFTVDGVPTELQLVAAVMIVITGIGVALVVPALRGHPAARGSGHPRTTEESLPS